MQKIIKKKLSTRRQRERRRYRGGVCERLTSTAKQLVCINHNIAVYANIRDVCVWAFCRLRRATMRKKCNDGKKTINQTEQTTKIRTDAWGPPHGVCAISTGDYGVLTGDGRRTLARRFPGIMSVSVVYLIRVGQAHVTRRRARHGVVHTPQEKYCRHTTDLY